ncbi:MAG: hypothetical protein JNJ58_07430 [Chitinophagaceae bacterium]|nr:hypothetical protein [Chitinophagaceae bacterium]
MKKLLFLTIICALTFSSRATIYRLGYPGIAIPGLDYAYNDFYSLQNAAVNGDTVQVYQQYFFGESTLDVQKNLKLIGYGYQLNINTGFQVMNLPDSSVLRGIHLTFNSGSAGSSAEGLFLKGANFGDSNLTVKRCKFYDNPNGCFYLGASGFIDNLLIQGCYFKGRYDTLASNWSNCQSGIGYTWGWTSSIKNLRFVNNIWEGRFFIPIIQNNTTGNSVNPSTGLIANNIFLHKKGFVESAELFRIDGPSYFFIKNNIFYVDSISNIGYWGNSYNSTKVIIPAGCVVQNNVSNLPASYNAWGGTNQWGLSNLFVSSFQDGYFASESGLQLAAGSPALTVGKNNSGANTPCGIYGGEPGYIYKLSGIPAIPAIYQLTAPSINATTNPYNITTSTRSNN